MTPDLFSATVVLDTSALHGSSTSGAPFQVLQGLAQAGLVKVFVPQLALEEFRTQWRERHLENAAQAGKALKALSGAFVLPPGLREKSAVVLSELDTINWDERSKLFVSGYVETHGFNIIPLTMSQCEVAWRDYFSGDLPSKKVKHRSDLPDAHIIAAVREFALESGEISFVSADKAQRLSVGELESAKCYENLELLLKSPKLQIFLERWQADQKWNALQSTLPFDEIGKSVKEFIVRNGRELLSSEEITDPAIPEDNHTASILMHGDPEEIELAGPESWGGGLLRYQATFFSECLLSWSVFRGDAYSLPDWVSVSSEINDHYLDAEGYAAVVAAVDVTVKVRVEDDEQGQAGSVEGIYFEIGSLELSLADYN